MSNAIVNAIVVTYNRKDLLMECLEALHNQTYPIHKIIIIDNASTDGTKEAVEERQYNNLEYILMESNTGGSGGFYQGLQKGREENCDWLWLMDDDTIPHLDSLEKLIRGIDIVKEKSRKPIGFVASTVYGSNGENMNVPNILLTPSENGYPNWYNFLDKGIVALESATFVSVLVNKEAVLKCGLPCRDYFIWGDDIEYTKRITNYYGAGYFIGESKVTHKRFNAKALDIIYEENDNRLKLYHLLYRNGAINTMVYERRSCLYVFAKGFKASIKMLAKGSGLQKAMIVLKGYLGAIGQCKRFKKYIENQISS